jgi:outer membrane protein OmpA-like peptidoglycan-associated protein
MIHRAIPAHVKGDFEMPGFAQRRLSLLVLNALAVMSLGGCATKEYVQQEVGALNQRIDELQARLASANGRIDQNSARLRDSESRLGGIEQSGQQLATRFDQTVRRVDKAEADLAGTGDLLTKTRKSLDTAHLRIDDLIDDLGRACFRIGENKQAIVQTNQRLDDALGLWNAMDARLRATDQRVEGALLDMATTRDRLANLQTIVQPDAKADPGKGVEVHIAPEMRVEPTPLPANASVASSTGGVAPAPLASTMKAGEGTAALQPQTVAQANLDAITAQIDQAAQRIANNTRAIEAANQRLLALESQPGGTQADKVTQITQRVDGLEAGVARQIAGLQAQVAEARQAAPIASANAASSDAVATVAKRVNDLEAGVARQIAGLQAQVAEARQAAPISGANVASGDASASSASKRIDDIEAGVARQLTSLQSQVAEARQAIATQGTALAASQQRVDRVEAAAADVAKRVEEQAQTLAANQRADQDVVRLMNELQSSLSALDTRVAADERALAANAEADAAAIKRVLSLEEGMSGVNTQLAQLRNENKDQYERLSVLEAALAVTTATAKEALERAIAAGKLAEGKLLFQTVLTDDVTQFPFGKSTLSKAAKDELKTFAEKLKSDNQNVFIEIQGHTDNVGGASGNMALGQARAEAVMSYLHTEFGIPLHRMSSMSYGESRPVASNKTKAGRALNRRVVLVVLK